MSEFLSVPVTWNSLDPHIVWYTVGSWRSCANERFSASGNGIRQ
jgi:hypothetical protein